MPFSLVTEMGDEPLSPCADGIGADETISLLPPPFWDDVEEALVSKVVPVPPVFVPVFPPSAVGDEDKGAALVPCTVVEDGAAPFVKDCVVLIS